MQHDPLLLPFSFKQLYDTLSLAPNASISQTDLHEFLLSPQCPLLKLTSYFTSSSASSSQYTTPHTTVRSLPAGNITITPEVSTLIDTCSSRLNLDHRICLFIYSISQSINSSTTPSMDDLSTIYVEERLWLLLSVQLIINIVHQQSHPLESVVEIGSSFVNGILEKSIELVTQVSVSPSRQTETERFYMLGIIISVADIDLETVINRLPLIKLIDCVVSLEKSFANLSSIDPSLLLIIDNNRILFGFLSFVLSYNNIANLMHLDDESVMEVPYKDEITFKLNELFKFNSPSFVFLYMILALPISSIRDQAAKIGENFNWVVLVSKFLDELYLSKSLLIPHLIPITKFLLMAMAQLFSDLIVDRRLLHISDLFQKVQKISPDDEVSGTILSYLFDLIESKVIYQLSNPADALLFFQTQYKEVYANNVSNNFSLLYIVLARYFVLALFRFPGDPFCLLTLLDSLLTSEESCRNVLKLLAMIPGCCFVFRTDDSRILIENDVVGDAIILTDDVDDYGIQLKSGLRLPIVPSYPASDNYVTTWIDINRDHMENFVQNLEESDGLLLIRSLIQAVILLPVNSIPYNFDPFSAATSSLHLLTSLSQFKLIRDEIKEFVFNLLNVPSIELSQSRHSSEIFANLIVLSSNFCIYDPDLTLNFLQRLFSIPNGTNFLLKSGDFALISLSFSSLMTCVLTLSSFLKNSQRRINILSELVNIFQHGFIYFSSLSKPKDFKNLNIYYRSLHLWLSKFLNFLLLPSNFFFQSVYNFCSMESFLRFLIDNFIDVSKKVTHPDAFCRSLLISIVQQSIKILILLLNTADDQKGDLPDIYQVIFDSTVESTVVNISADLSSDPFFLDDICQFFAQLSRSALVISSRPSVMGLLSQSNSSKLVAQISTSASRHHSLSLKLPGIASKLSQLGLVSGIVGENLVTELLKTVKDCENFIDSPNFEADPFCSSLFTIKQLLLNSFVIEDLGQKFSNFLGESVFVFVTKVVCKLLQNLDLSTGHLKFLSCCLAFLGDFVQTGLNSDSNLSDELRYVLEEFKNLVLNLDFASLCTELHSTLSNFESESREEITSNYPMFEYHQVFALMLNSASQSQILTETTQLVNIDLCSSVLDGTSRPLNVLTFSEETSCYLKFSEILIQLNSIYAKLVAFSDCIAAVAKLHLIWSSLIQSTSNLPKIFDLSNFQYYLLFLQNTMLAIFTFSESLTCQPNFKIFTTIFNLILDNIFVIYNVVMSVAGDLIRENDSVADFLDDNQSTLIDHVYFLSRYLDYCVLSKNCINSILCFYQFLTVVHPKLTLSSSIIPKLDHSVSLFIHTLASKVISKQVSLKDSKICFIFCLCGSLINFGFPIDLIGSNVFISELTNTLSVSQDSKFSKAELFDLLFVLSRDQGVTNVLLSKISFTVSLSHQILDTISTKYSFFRAITSLAQNADVTRQSFLIDVFLSNEENIINDGALLSSSFSIDSIRLCLTLMSFLTQLFSIIDRNLALVSNIGSIRLKILTTILTCSAKAVSLLYLSPNDRKSKIRKENGEILDDDGLNSVDFYVSGVLDITMSFLSKISVSDVYSGTFLDLSNLIDPGTESLTNQIVSSAQLHSRGQNNIFNFGILFGMVNLLFQLSRGFGGRRRSVHDSDLRLRTTPTRSPTRSPSIPPFPMPHVGSAGSLMYGKMIKRIARAAVGAATVLIRCGTDDVRRRAIGFVKVVASSVGESSDAAFEEVSDYGNELRALARYEY
ncbi:hypothetical protein P9112_005469 [Eukaryota sp. TZLM1-RC]